MGNSFVAAGHTIRNRLLPTIHRKKNERQKQKSRSLRGTAVSNSGDQLLPLYQSKQVSRDAGHMWPAVRQLPTSVLECWGTTTKI